MLTALLWVWGGLTVVFIGLLIYRGTLTMHEDDQLFLDDAESHMAKEQADLLRDVDKLKPWVRLSGAGSALLILVIAVIWLYQGFNRGLP